MRDSRTGYVIPAHNGIGVWPDGKIVDASSSSSASSGNSGWHSGQETIFGGFPEVLDSWWEISENGDRGSTQNFAADVMSIVVCPGEPFLEKLFRIRKYTLFENGYVPKFQKCQFSKGPVFPGSQVLRMDCFPVYVHSQVLRMDCFPVYVHSQVLRMDCFPIFFNCWLILA